MACSVVVGEGDDADGGDPYHVAPGCFVVFFFQAEDGIRDHCVTGVQTCALPICLLGKSQTSDRSMHAIPENFYIACSPSLYPRVTKSIAYLKTNTDPK